MHSYRFCHEAAQMRPTKHVIWYQNAKLDSLNTETTKIYEKQPIQNKWFYEMWNFNTHQIKSISVILCWKCCLCEFSCIIEFINALPSILSVFPKSLINSIIRSRNIKAYMYLSYDTKVAFCLRFLHPNIKIPPSVNLTLL